MHSCSSQRTEKEDSVKNIDFRLMEQQHETMSAIDESAIQTTAYYPPSNTRKLDTRKLKTLHDHDFIGGSNRCRNRYASRRLCVRSAQRTRLVRSKNGHCANGNKKNGVRGDEPLQANCVRYTMHPAVASLGNCISEQDCFSCLRRGMHKVDECRISTVF